MMRRASQGPARSAPFAIAASLGLAGLGLGLAALAGTVAAQTQGETAAVESSSHGYTVTLPAGCRHEKGPGTVDAVCSPDFDPAKSAVATAAGALVLAVAAESLNGAGDKSIADLLQHYSEAGFKEELPQSVCGESDRARVKIENLSQSVEGGRVVYSADVVCAEIRFLQIGARRATVRHLIGPDTVYRLVARAPEQEFEKHRATIDAFFASFRLAPGEKADK